MSLNRPEHGANMHITLRLIDLDACSVKKILESYGSGELNLALKALLTEMIEKRKNKHFLLNG